MSRYDDLSGESHQHHKESLLGISASAGVESSRNLETEKSRRISGSLLRHLWERRGRSINQEESREEKSVMRDKERSHEKWSQLTVTEPGQKVARFRDSLASGGSQQENIRLVPSEYRDEYHQTLESCDHSHCVYPSSSGEERSSAKDDRAKIDDNTSDISDDNRNSPGQGQQAGADRNHDSIENLSDDSDRPSLLIQTSTLGKKKRLKVTLFLSLSATPLYFVCNLHQKLKLQKRILTVFTIFWVQMQE